ncbi:uncharacterized protein FPRO_14509 [Fusarium proliferatum ET1]|uniref:Uncharacterized protein n=1 Tax=Fusarium proliferatum (strain ET1) TaxID=1227346 RepID=A0A1L7VWD2_FUSPR|nr:uncharacterized protein FPRO_14509 [Fusarium proliferatum ET1]CZR44757.1 uncharacterized protein FPRO_14509 [Fusarium proliferatum ET1]
MPPKMPRLDDLLALLEVYFAPEMGVLPGRTATKAELEAQLRPPLVFVLLPISSISPIPASNLPPPHWLDRPSSLVIAVLSGFFGPPRLSPDPPCYFEQSLKVAC